MYCSSGANCSLAAGQPAAQMKQQRRAVQTVSAASASSDLQLINDATAADAKNAHHGFRDRSRPSATQAAVVSQTGGIRVEIHAAVMTTGQKLPYHLATLQDDLQE